MIKNPEFKAKFESLSGLEKACVVLLIARKKITGALRKTGVLGALPIYLVNESVKEVIWRIDQNIAPVIDEIENKEFMRDLNDFKEQYEIGEEASVLYIGSGNDTSVQRVFPQTVHIDIEKPKRMPKNYRFIEASACHLPNVESETVDIAIVKYFNTDTLEMPAIAQELERMLQPTGKVLNHGNIGNIDFSKEPQTIEDVISQNRTLRILKNFYGRGIQATKQFPNGTVLMEKREIDDNFKRQLDETYSRNRKIYYKLVLASNTELAMFSQEEVNDVRIIEYALGVPIFDCRYMDWEYFEKILEKVKAEAPPEAYRIIEARIKKFLSKGKR